MTARPPGVGRSTVQRLASFRAPPGVSSLYLDVDGAHRPVAATYERAFEHLAEELRRRARARADIRPADGPALLRSVEGDIDRMRAWLHDGVDRARTRGVALFSCSAEDWFEAVPLVAAVRDETWIGDGPRIRQLAEAADHPEPVLAALVDRAHLRLMRITGRQVEDLGSFVTPPERDVDHSVELGGWEHRHAEAVRAHLRRATAAVEDAVASGRCERLVLGGPAESVGALERALDPATRARVVGRVGVRGSAPVEEIAVAVRAVAEVAERQREAAMVEDLRQRSAAGDGGVTGLERTLAALGDRRVAMLLVREGFSAPGGACPECGHVGPSLRQCPLCGATNVEIDDVVELAIEQAVTQGALVEFCRDTELDRFGGIAAMGRY
ncbi:MAG TPA: hypothetical protein VFO65_14645 [Acidimicrobiales bacterium]|nr:hypothetical protein [Acidimicrobiales bacterium]